MKPTKDGKRQTLAWIYLVVAGVMEIGFALGLKGAQGFTRLGPSVFTIISTAASLYFLSLAIRTIPIGTAYVVWTGIGAVGTAIGGMVIWHEERSMVRLAFIALIVIGMIGLHHTRAMAERQ